MRNSHYQLVGYPVDWNQRKNAMNNKKENSRNKLVANVVQSNNEGSFNNSKSALFTTEQEQYLITALGLNSQSQ